MGNPNLPISGKYNTYIGARYVPLMGGEWNQDKAYEPLVIVTHQGNSYTSNTFVPAGTDINDKTYWTLTGNYNGQVEQYRSEVEGVKQEVNQLNSDLSTTNNNLTELENTVNENKVNTDNAIAKSNIMLLGSPQPSQTTISCITPYELALPGFKTVHQDTGVHDFHSVIDLNVDLHSNIIYIVLDKSNFESNDTQVILNNLGTSISNLFNKLPAIDGLKYMPKIWVTLDELLNPTLNEVIGYTKLHYMLYQIQTGNFNYSSLGFVYGCAGSHFSNFKPFLQTLCYQICRNVLQTPVSSYKPAINPVRNWKAPDITIRTEAVTNALRCPGIDIYSSTTPLTQDGSTTKHKIGSVTLTDGVWPSETISTQCMINIRDQASSPTINEVVVGKLSLHATTQELAVYLPLNGHTNIKYLYLYDILFPLSGISRDGEINYSDISITL